MFTTLNNIKEAGLTGLMNTLKRQGRSQTWLAGELGVTPNCISCWARGINEPSAAHMLMIARALLEPGVTLPDMLFRIFFEDLEV